MADAAQTDEDDFTIETDEDDAPIIEVVDTTPEKDKGKDLLPVEKEVLEEPDEDELATYSDRVKKRIGDATFKFHDQRRKRELSERERDEAFKFAQEALRQKQQAEAALYQYEAGYVDQAKSRVDIELSQATSEFKAAFEVGDADKMAAAQAKLATLAVQKDQFSRFSPREAPAQQEYIPPVQHRPADDDADKFIAWREKNKWFDQDETLKDFAMGVHARYVSNSPELIGTEDYYRDIEKRTKTAFPAKFPTEQQARTEVRTSPVTGVSRTSGAEKTRKTVKLTTTQMALIRKLNITPQEYVRQQNKIGE